MNNYNEFMSHIRVDDATRRRVMSAVSDVLDREEAGKTDNGNELFVRKRTDNVSSSSSSNHGKNDAHTSQKASTGARITPLKIMSFAAAAIILAFGTYAVLKFGIGDSFTKSMTAQENAVDSVDGKSHNAEVQDVDSEMDSAVTVAGIAKDNAEKVAEEGAEEAAPAAAGENEGMNIYAGGSTAALDRNSKTNGVKSFTGSTGDIKVTLESKTKEGIEGALPFACKSMGTGKFGEVADQVVYTGNQGEKVIVISAEGGFDLTVKSFYPGFKGEPVKLSTPGGISYSAVSSKALNGQSETSSEPFECVSFEKNSKVYLIVVTPSLEEKQIALMIDSI